MQKKRIAVLGATGSIGQSALDIISRDKENLEVILLSAHSNAAELEKLSAGRPSAVCVLTGKEGGKENLLTAINDLHPDITINGISGAAGLEPSLAVINAAENAETRLALANKETVVMASELVFRKAKEKNVKIIPVDSEHSAIFHLLEAFKNNETQSTQSAYLRYDTEELDFFNPITLHNSASSALRNIQEIILTASGGPFRKLSMQELEKVTAQDALAHPTWKMGQKITIDSASMANKGLEIIEACAFFEMPVEKIKVVLHPQSIVHSMIKLCNGVIYAQLSKPDMRHPIHDAIYWPEIKPLNLETLNFDNLTLEFEKPDFQKFPMLSLAMEAAKAAGLYPCAYNAANEEAVKAFISGKIGFTGIPKVTRCVLEGDIASEYNSIEAVLDADINARRKAMEYIRKIQ